MTNSKFAAGAFVFTRARGVEPRLPDELEPLAVHHGIDPIHVPTYPGDRTTIGRAITQASAGLHREGFLLRPITRSSSQVVYGIVREKRDEDDRRLDHDFEATVAWSAEPDPSLVAGDHPIAQRVADAYQELRGKVTADDWSGAITAYLLDHDAARIRNGVYWVPPQRVADLRQLGAFLADVGIDLVLCEIEPESRTVVEHVARDTLDEQLAQLEVEVEQFDGTQKPSTYARRLDEFQRLRERAILYRDALGVGVDKAEQVLGELEQKVSTMLELRRHTVVDRHGTITETRDNTQPTDLASVANSVPHLRFAGAEFTLATETDQELVFTSGDDFAVASIRSLESMGLADRWQNAGPAKVKIKISNSGPPGAEVTIAIRRPGEQPLAELSASLGTLGIEIAN